MDYTQLGRSGLSVSRIVLGTMNFGPVTDEPASHAIMDRAHEHGINFFDTANVYGWGENKGRTEEIIGSWFAQGGGRRERTVLATKLYGDMGDWPNEGRLSALNIRRACDASLRRLQTDHIDLYQMHHVDRATPWEEIWGAMDVLRQQGKVLYVGSSNFAGWHLAKAQEAARRRGGLGLVSEQSIYNLMERSVELEVLPAADDYGLGVIPWSPLHGRAARRGAAQGARGGAADPGPGPGGAGVAPRADRRLRGPVRRAGLRAGRRGAGLAAVPARGDRADRRAADAGAAGHRRLRPSTSSWTRTPWPGWTRSSPARAARPRRPTPGDPLDLSG